jgi:hypothetical protein
MDKKLLLVHFVVGPTYKDRMIYNLLTYPSYSFFDVLILTNDVEYFSSISHMINVFVVDIDEVRKDYPWSIDLETVPKEKISEELYAKEMTSSWVKVPTLMERFAFIWKNAQNYDGFLFLNSDVIPVMNETHYEKILDYFVKPISIKGYEDKIIFIPSGGVNGDVKLPNLEEDTLEINNRYKITDKPLDFRAFIHNDGNFRTFKFPDKSKIKPFFDILNTIVYEVKVAKRLPRLGVHTIWDLHSEQIVTIALNLSGAVGLPMSPFSGIEAGDVFRLESYPEDKFWLSDIMTPSNISKQDFIEKNSIKLNEYYQNNFPYKNK